MVVECVSNNPKEAEQTARYLGVGSGSNLSEFPITVGKTYTVYGISEIKESQKLYLILDDDQTEGDYPLIKTDDYEPVWYDSNLFRVADESLDPQWQTMPGTMWTNTGKTVSFPEFIKDGRRFYAELLDGDIERVRTFSRYITKYTSTQA